MTAGIDNYWVSQLMSCCHWLHGLCYPVPFSNSLSWTLNLFWYNCVTNMPKYWPVIFFFFFTSYACYLCVESERNWGDTAGRCRCEMISHIKSSLLWENIQSALTVLQQNNQPVKSAVKASVHHSAESCRADANIQHLDDKLTTELCSPVLCATTFIILKVSECFHHISRHRLTSESLSNSTVAWTCAICLAQAGMQIGINQRH